MGDAGRQTQATDNVLQTGSIFISKLIDTIGGLFGHYFGQAGQPGSGGQGIGIVGAEMDRRAQGRDESHQIPPTAESAQGRAAPDGFGQTNQIRFDIVSLAGTAHGETTSNLDFVKN